jgi:alanine racemase
MVNSESSSLTSIDARPTWATIDTDAVAHNLREVRHRVRPDMRIAMSLKCDAYGHGALPIARVAEREGVDLLMTESFHVAAGLRHGGIGLPITMLAAAVPSGFEQILRAGFAATIYSLPVAEAISQLGGGPYPVYVKVDCGLGRVGVPLEDAASLVTRIAELSGISLAGVYTHLPFADSRGEAWARERVDRFDDLLRELRASGIQIPMAQAASTAGVSAGLDSPQLTHVCVGSAAFGLPAVAALDTGWMRRPFTALRSRLIDVTAHSSRRRAGRGGERVYEAGSTTGVLPIGIGDGFRLPTYGDAYALVNGARARIVTVAFAHTILELSGVLDPVVGAEVVLIGRQGSEEISLEDVARWTGQTASEVVLSLSGRVVTEHVAADARIQVPAGDRGAVATRY